MKDVALGCLAVFNWIDLLDPIGTRVNLAVLTRSTYGPASCGEAAFLLNGRLFLLFVWM